MGHLLFSLQLSLPSIQYLENCRLVRSGTKQFDDHCLPTTISGEMEELLNMTRRDNFLVYLQCWELCEAYGLPLTEDTQAVVCPLGPVLETGLEIFIQF